MISSSKNSDTSKNILYVRVKKENKEWLIQNKKTTGTPIDFYVDSLLDALREAEAYASNTGKSKPSTSKNTLGKGSVLRYGNNRTRPLQK